MRNTLKFHEENKNSGFKTLAYGWYAKQQQPVLFYWSHQQ